jgi:ornithine cyclodeaminase/alanine dehydrogenase-like protein (mu-crystallin family)
VADSLDQCAEIGELHHALASGAMKKSDIYAELSDLAAGRKPGRSTSDEVTLFDSTGTALQDSRRGRRRLREGRASRKRPPARFRRLAKSPRKRADSGC